LSADIQTTALQLWQLTVAEWMENSALYEGFLLDMSVEEEAPNFLVPGYFHGHLADTMLTSLSTVYKPQPLSFPPLLAIHFSV